MIVKVLLLAVGIILLVEKYGAPVCEARGIDFVTDGTVIEVSGSSELPNDMDMILAAARLRRTKKQRQTRTKRYSHNRSRVHQRTRFRVGTSTTTTVPTLIEPVINDLEDPVILQNDSDVAVVPLILLDESTTTENYPSTTKINEIVEISEIQDNKISEIGKSTEKPIEVVENDHVTTLPSTLSTDKSSEENSVEISSTNAPNLEASNELQDAPIKIVLPLQDSSNSTENVEEPIISNPINYISPIIAETPEIVLKIENASVSEDLEATTIKIEPISTTERVLQTTQSTKSSEESSSSETKPSEPNSAEIDKILNLELIKQEYSDPGDYNKLPNKPAETKFKVPIKIVADNKLAPIKIPVIHEVLTTTTTTMAPIIVQEPTGDYNNLPNSNATVAEESSESSEEVNSVESESDEEPEEPEDPDDKELLSNVQMSEEDTKYGPGGPGNSDYYFMLSNDQMEVFEEDEYLNE